MNLSFGARAIKLLRHIIETLTTSASATRTVNSSSEFTWKCRMPVLRAAKRSAMRYATCAKQIVRFSLGGSAMFVSVRVRRALGLDEREQALQQCDRIGRAAANMQIDRHHLAHAADDGVAAGKNPAVSRAIANRDDPFRIRGCRIGALQRLAHVFCHRTGDQQHVGVARGGDKAQAEALEVVESV